MLNMIGLVIFSAALFFYARKLSWYKRILKSSEATKKMVGAWLFLYSFLLLSLVYVTITSLNKHAQWTLDVTEELNYVGVKAGALFIFFLSGLIFFFHVLQVLTDDRRNSQRKNV